MCLDDVASSDIYVGIFAWRYGYIPDDDKYNPNNLSITELEYEKAKKKGILCLIFLIDEETVLSPRYSDGMAQSGVISADNINRLRKELRKNHSISFFKNPDELATNVLAAANQSLKKIDTMNILKDEKVLKKSEEFMDKVKEKMDVYFDKIVLSSMVTIDT